MINTSSRNMFTFHFSSARLVKLARLSTHSTSARLQDSILHSDKKNGKSHNIYSICFSRFAKPAACLKQPSRLKTGGFRADRCFWSGCLLICHKCVSASVWYDLIRQQSPLFSSSPISWYGWRGSSVVIFRVVVAVSGFIAGKDSEPGERVRWCKENS